MSRLELLEVIGLILVVLSSSVLVFESSRISEASMRRVTGILNELCLRSDELELAISVGDSPPVDETAESQFSFAPSESRIAESIKAHAELNSQSFSYFRNLRGLGFWTFLIGCALVILGRCLSIRNRSNNARHGGAPSPPCA